MASTSFETVVCGRCGGSGHYSFNMIDGTRCYGCGGGGKKYTKRGRAAHDFYESLMMVPVTSLKVGDSIQGFTKFHKIVSIHIGNAKEHGCYAGDGNYEQAKIMADGYTTYLGTDDKVRKAFSREEKQVFFARALEYQDSLTKAGKPTKRAAKETADCN